MCNVFGIHVDVTDGLSFIVEDGSQLLHEHRLLDPEGDGRTPIRNVANHLLANMTQHQGRRGCLSTLLRGPEVYGIEIS
jgi:hypothetical protein